MVLPLFPDKELNTLEYSNPKIPEGINTSKEHPLKEFVLLTGGVLATIAGLMLVLILLSDFLIDYVPFSWEKSLSEPFTRANSTDSSAQESKPIEIYLKQLADRISVAQNLPQGMTIKIHFLNSESVNAFATLDGHVFFFRGLLEKLPNENALAMVLAHEIAHIKFRHPIHGLGRGVLVGLVMSVISSSIGDVIMQNFISEAGILTVLKFSRDMERESDKAALESVISLYGHMKGADDLFKVLQQETEGGELYEFFSTHPLTENRISSIHKKSAQHRNSKGAKVTPLPKAFFSWLTPVKKEKPSLSETPCSSGV